MKYQEYIELGSRINAYVNKMKSELSLIEQLHQSIQEKKLKFSEFQQTRVFLPLTIVPDWVTDEFENPNYIIGAFSYPCDLYVVVYEKMIEKSIFEFNKGLRIQKYQFVTHVYNGLEYGFDLSEIEKILYGVYKNEKWAEYKQSELQSLVVEKLGLQGKCFSDYRSNFWNNIRTGGFDAYDSETSIFIDVGELIFKK